MSVQSLKQEAFSILEKAGLSSTTKDAVKDFVTVDWHAGSLSKLVETLKHQEKENGEKELQAQFCKLLEFGTAGLRGPMGIGFNRMCHVSVMGASRAIGLWCLEKFGVAAVQSRPVVIGYDGRHNSREMAHTTAAVFLQLGFGKVLLFSENVPTPMNPYTLMKKSGIVGIQVTASHNPKEDNGYKVYADNGAQIIPPMDAEVFAIIKNKKSEPIDLSKWLNDDLLLKPHPQVEDPLLEMTESYLKDITAALKTESFPDGGVPAVYTAMHGVGQPMVLRLSKEFGYSNIYPVPQQGFPDPEFSTVKFPNPEEKGALDLAIALATEKNCTLVLANDPDADRFAAAERQPDGKWKIFHGDELGIILSEYRMRSRRDGKPPLETKKMAFICSAVSSRMMGEMAEQEGAVFEETMTGFKWMMNRAKEMEGEGYTPICVYEEALGYGLSMAVPDKDGISALCVFMELATKLKKQGKSVSQHLDDLRKKYGYFVTNNSYYLCYDKAAINDMFAEFRNGGKYTKSVGEFEISRIRDVTTGYDDGAPGNKCAFPLSPSSQMVTLFFKNGAHITLRTSGTEPKIKWYAELGGSDPEAARKELEKVVAASCKQILQPSKYPLYPAGSPPPS